MISGLIIIYTGFTLIDTFISLLIALIILLSTWRLLKESMCLSLDAVPSSIHINEIEKMISNIPGIQSWHHLHIWAISTTENAATVHIVLEDIRQMENIKQQLRHKMHEMNIQHITIECEASPYICNEPHCC